MFKKSAIWVPAIMLALFIAAPVVCYAGAVLPSTAINEVLSLKSGLQLTDDQVNKLTGYNNKIIDKMIQVRAQAEIRKTEIDEFTSDWAKLHGTASNYLVKEYYQLMADYKSLELEAIMKARAVLTREQMKSFVQLASIHNMTMKLETEVASIY